MDELKLLEDLRRETPPITAAAAQAARARLLAAAAESQPPAPRRGARGRLSRAGWRVAIAAALGVALTAVTVARDLGADPQRPQQAGPAGLLGAGVANAAELGARAASAAAARPAANPRPNQWLYLEQLFAETGSDAPPFAPVGARRVTRRSWNRIDAKRFAYEHRGRLHQLPNHQLSPVYPWRTFAYVSRLPADPRALLARLYATVSGGQKPYDHARFSREEQHRMVFDFIGDVLRDNIAPPGVQAAIFRALPMIPGVRLQRDAVDAAGRHGVAFARVHDGHVRTELILDPRTYQYLGLRQIVVEDFVAKNVTFRGKKVEPHVAKGTVFDWQARTAAAIVDRPGQRP
jgi:hypothetical protein